MIIFSLYKLNQSIMDFERDNQKRIKQFWADKIDKTESLAKNCQYVFPKTKLSLKQNHTKNASSRNLNSHSEKDDSSFTSIPSVYNLHSQNSKHEQRGNNQPYLYYAEKNQKENAGVKDMNFEEMCQAGLSSLLIEQNMHRYKP